MINNVENSKNDAKSVIKGVRFEWNGRSSSGPVLAARRWRRCRYTLAARSCEVWALFEVGRQRPLCSSARAHARADTQTGKERLTKRESARERERARELRLFLRAPAEPVWSLRSVAKEMDGSNGSAVRDESCSSPPQKPAVFTGITANTVTRQLCTSRGKRSFPQRCFLSDWTGKQNGNKWPAFTVHYKLERAVNEKNRYVRRSD